MKKILSESFIKTLTLGSLFIMYLLVVQIFWNAWRSPSKTTLVYINFFGEATQEAIILIFIAVLIPFGFYLIARDHYRSIMRSI